MLVVNSQVLEVKGRWAYRIASQGFARLFFFLFALGLADSMPLVMSRSLAGGPGTGSTTALSGSQRPSKVMALHYAPWQAELVASPVFFLVPQDCVCVCDEFC